MCRLWKISPQTFWIQLNRLLFIEMHAAVVISTNGFGMKWTNFMNLAIGLCTKWPSATEWTDKNYSFYCFYATVFGCMRVCVCDGLFDHRNVINIWNDNWNYILCYTKQIPMWGIPMCYLIMLMQRYRLSWKHLAIS